MRVKTVLPLLVILWLMVGSCLCVTTVALAQTQTQTQTLSENKANNPLGYIGDTTRFSIGYDSEFVLYGEFLRVFGEREDAAWLFGAWLAEDAGGAQLDYNWVIGEASEDDRRWVNKLFLAFDQNDEQDRKLSAGWGFENQDYFLNAYASASISGKRQVGQRSDSATEVVTFEQDGSVFNQTRTTTTFTDLFERPYDYGVGLRAGRMFEQPLLRVQGGLDYEWGDEDNADASQITASVSSEKFFYNSPHSLALHAEVYHKSGDFEDDEDDARVRLLYRYNFGQAYRPLKPTTAASPAAERVVKNDITLATDAFFDFDRATLRPQAIAALNELVGQLRAAEVIGTIEITGHTCDIGTEAYNLSLSKRRAAAVREYFIAQGFSPTRLNTAGRGEQQPQFRNDSEANRRKNRRVDISVMTQREMAGATPPAVIAKAEPVWLRRALRNPSEHKRTVDYYRIERTRSEISTGPVTPVNSAPQALDDSATVAINSSANVINVLANDSDPDGDSLSISTISQPANGMVTNNGSNVSYTPNPDFTGVDTFTYTIVDPGGASATASVTVQVGGVGANRPPQANDDNAVTNQDTRVTIAVLANDSDPDGDELSVSAVTQPTNGTVVINGTRVTYIPAPGFRGVDSFTYTIIDGNGGSDTATVTVRMPRY